MKNERLFQARMLRGWTQRKVAQAIDTDEKRVGEWERGEASPSPVFRERLCQLFGCSAEDLGLIPAVAPVLGAGLWPDDLVSVYHRGVLSLHDLYFRGNPYHVQTILPLYGAQTSALVQPGVLSTPAARVASLAQQLTCELATDREDFGAAYQAGQQALRFAQIANDKSLQVASLIGLANLGFHRRQSTIARAAYERAIGLFDETVTPLLKGRTLAGAAEVYAMRQEYQDAMRAMGQAYEAYPMQPEEDPAYPYLHASRYALYVFGDTQSRLFLNQPKEADAALVALDKEQNTDADNEPVTMLDLLYYRAESMAQQNEIEASSEALERAGMLSKQLGSRLYFGKLTETYETMRARWPHERQIGALADVFASW